MISWSLKNCKETNFVHRTGMNEIYKNLAIANKSRVNIAHNTSRALIGLNITP